MSPNERAVLPLGSEIQIFMPARGLIMYENGLLTDALL
jgi:hypothetical protein